jgi:hypothetical protein
METDEVEIKDFGSWLDKKLKKAFAFTLTGLNERFIAYHNCCCSIIEDSISLHKIVLLAHQIRASIPNAEQKEALSSMLCNMINVCDHQITARPAIIDYIYFSAFRNAAKQHISSLELSLHPFYHLKQQSGKSLLGALTHELEILKEQYNDILKREVIIDPILKRISEIQCV